MYHDEIIPLTVFSYEPHVLRTACFLFSDGIKQRPEVCGIVRSRNKPVCSDDKHDRKGGEAEISCI